MNNLSEDAYWNKVYEVDARKWAIVYYIHLAWEKKPRKMGTMKSDWIMYMERDRDLHLFHKANSYGFNEYLLRHILNNESTIIIKEKGRVIKLKTTVKNILLHWQYLFFKQQWFENQMFLNINDFSIAV